MVFESKVIENVNKSLQQSDDHDSWSQSLSSIIECLCHPEYGCDYLDRSCLPIRLPCTTQRGNSLATPSTAMGKGQIMETESERLGCVEHSPTDLPGRTQSAFNAPAGFSDLIRDSPAAPSAVSHSVHTVCLCSYSERSIWLNFKRNNYRFCSSLCFYGSTARNHKTRVVSFEILWEIRQPLDLL